MAGHRLEPMKHSPPPSKRRGGSTFSTSLRAQRPSSIRRWCFWRAAWLYKGGTRWGWGLFVQALPNSAGSACQSPPLRLLHAPQAAASNACARHRGTQPTLKTIDAHHISTSALHCHTNTTCPLAQPPCTQHTPHTAQPPRTSAPQRTAQDPSLPAPRRNVLKVLVLERRRHKQWLRAMRPLFACGLIR
jgi:hypothetical protein